MESTLPLFKPSALVTAKSALTSITPDVMGNDTGMDRQLSDDAAAPPQVSTPLAMQEDELKSTPIVAPMLQTDVQHNPTPEEDDEESLPYVSPFAGIPEPEEQIDSVDEADEAARTALYHEMLTSGAVDSGSPSALDASRQHHLLRHSLPSEQRGTGVLSHFGVETISDAAKIIKKMSQRELQAKFKVVYGARTFSNNNNWLRRKLFESIGLDPSKGAVKKPGVGTQRRRRPSNKSPAAPRAVGVPRQRRAPRTLDDLESQPIAEALIALGELASLAYDGYDLDELEEAAAAAEEANGTDGRVPSAGLDDGRLRWVAAELSGRGVPRAGTASPDVVLRGQQLAEEDMEEDEEAAAAAVANLQDSPPPAAAPAAAAADNMLQMFEWAARMQRQAMEAAGPQHAAMVAAMMGGGGAAAPPPHVQVQAQQLQALQMAAMAGHPQAQQMLHALMTAGQQQQQQQVMMPRQEQCTPELFHRMMQEAVANATLHHQQQQQQQHGYHAVHQMVHPQ